MQPRIKLTQKEVQKKIELYEKSRMTGHHVYGPWFEATAENPRNYGGELVKPPVIERASLNVVRDDYSDEDNERLNNLRRRLIGY